MRIATCSIAALLFVFAMAAYAGGDKPATWARKPSPTDLRAVWPRTAVARRSGGEATIHCKVSDKGELADCQLLSEGPEGGGFGGAALALAGKMRMKPAIRDGAPAESAVTVMIRFPDPAALEASTGSILPGGPGAARVDIYDPPPGGAPSGPEF